jgi:hypothetical protein
VSVPSRIYNNRQAGLLPTAKPLNPYHYQEYASLEIRQLVGTSFPEVKLLHQAPQPEFRALASILPVVSLMWHNPALRLGRWLHRVGARTEYTSRLSDLLSAIPAGIFEESAGDKRTIVFVSVASGPLGIRKQQGL